MRADLRVRFANKPRPPAAPEPAYRDLFENATDIVFTTDLSGHFLSGNRAVRRLLGYTVDEARRLTWAKLVAPYEMGKAAAMWRRHARGEVHLNFELDTYTKSGALKTFEIGSRPIFVAGRIVGFHGIARDVTERKRMQRALIEARRAAEQANRAKTAFLANMSHEIRTPINGILGFVSLISKTDLSAEQRRLLRPVEESAVNLLKLIDDVLDLSRIESGHVPIDPEAIYLPAVLNTHLNLLRPLAEQKGLALRLRISPSARAWVLGDPTRIGQVVTNLVNNAIKFTERGIVSVHLSRTRSGTVTLIVRDTGAGIPANRLAGLFAPFQQVDTRRKRRHGGVGLGLAITKNLVDAMGGDIDIDSKAHSHTRVQVRLPLPTAAAPKTGSHRSADQRFAVGRRSFQGADLRVLVVDDNRINREYLCQALRQMGVAVAEAGSGAQAVHQCALRSWDLILMDIHMAEMDGVETMRRIRAASRARMPVVGVSADVVDGGEEFLRAGMDGFLAKPVSETQLCACLRAQFPGRVLRTHARADAALIDEARGVSLACGDRGLWLRSLKTLGGALPAQTTALRAALLRRDLLEIAAGAHRLAGAAAYVGALRLHCAAARLERDCRGAPRGLPSLVAVLVHAAVAVERIAIHQE